MSNSCEASSYASFGNGAGWKAISGTIGRDYAVLSTRPNMEGKHWCPG